MGFFVFIGLVVGSLAGFLLLRTLTSRQGPETPLVRLGMTSGENEAQLWQQALARAGIWSRLIGGTSGAYRSRAVHQDAGRSPLSPYRLYVDVEPLDAFGSKSLGREPFTFAGPLQARSV